MASMLNNQLYSWGLPFRNKLPLNLCLRVQDYKWPGLQIKFEYYLLFTLRNDIGHRAKI